MVCEGFHESAGYVRLAGGVQCTAQGVQSKAAWLQVRHAEGYAESCVRLEM